MRKHQVFAFLLISLFQYSIARGREVPSVGEAVLNRWSLLGPFAVHCAPQSPSFTSLRSLGFEADLLADSGGEAQLVSTTNCVTWNGQPLVWQRVESARNVIDLAESFESRSWSVAYAATSFESAGDMERLLGVGSDDAIRIWLNGQLVHDNWVVRPLRPNDDLVKVQLKKGMNHILLKVANGQGNWGFSCTVLTAVQQAQMLVKAAASGNEERVRKLIDQGVEINAISPHTITPWQAAKLRGFDHIADLLVSKGAKTDIPFSPTRFLRSVLESRTKESGPGVAVLVSRGGKIIFQDGFGMANLEHDIPVVSKTKFRIGSVTKQFASAAILKLQEEGQLNVNDSLAKYIRDFPRGDAVRIHHLLTHTSGIKSFTSKPEFISTVTLEKSTEEMIESFKHDPFDFDPGEKWSYNNSGYLLLGYIIEKVSGQDFGQYLNETFFQPLGMHDTGVHDATTVLKLEATGYSHTDDGVRKAIDWNMSQAGAAGNLYSTVEDLYRWNEAVFTGELLSAQSMDVAFTPVQVDDENTAKVPYGFGWTVDENRGLRRIRHNGGLHGFLGSLVRYPGQDLTIAVLHNSSPPMPGLAPEELVNIIASTYLGEFMKSSPKDDLDERVDPATYQQLVGHYEYGPGASLTVTVEDDRLYAQLTGQPRFEIYPAATDRFFWKVVKAQIEFVRDENGMVTAARHSQGSLKFVAPKLKEEKIIDIAAETLDGYVGKYSYKGLGTLTVRRDGRQLKAQMTGQPEFDIYPKSEVEFFWKVVKAEIRFVLNDNGRIEKAIHKQGGATIEAKKIE